MLDGAVIQLISGSRLLDLLNNVGFLLTEHMQEEEANRPSNVASSQNKVICLLG